MSVVSPEICDRHTDLVGQRARTLRRLREAERQGDFAAVSRLEDQADALSAEITAVEDAAYHAYCEAQDARDAERRAHREAMSPQGRRALLRVHG